MEIIVFSNGDAYSPQTWSNVPYYAVKTLEKLGNTVHCISIESDSKLIKLLKKYINKVFRLILGRDTLFLIEAFPISRIYEKKKIRDAVKKYPNSDMLLFFTFNVSGKGISNIPSVLFYDFTIEYTISKINKREIKWYEKKLVTMQDKIIREADLVISLFPKAAEHYIKYYKTRNIDAIQGHIINCDENIFDIENTIKNKYESNIILFIGRRRYRKGALCLINTIEKYNEVHPTKKLEVVIIGMATNDLKIKKVPWVTYLGILDKLDTKQKTLYYAAINKSFAIINTTLNWGGISSMTEAMWLYTPIVTTNYEDFIEIFGKNIDFGYYCKGENKDDLLSKLEILKEKNYEEYTYMCMSAHTSVKKFTWDNCINQILEKFHMQNASSGE